MKKVLQLVVFLALVAAVSVGACFLMRCCLPIACGHCSAITGSADPHLWVHEQLGLTPEQERQLEPLEARHHAQTQDLQEVIRLANMELGQTLLDEKGASPKVTAAIAKVHAAQGELQQKAIEHVIEMKGVLSPEQYQKLLNLTADALYQIDR